MKKRKIIITLVILLAIGFASVSTTLVINGIVGIASKQDDFNIIFTNAKLNNIERKDFIEPNKKQSLTFETNKLTDINQEAVLDYEVTNTSRLYDADVKIVCNMVDNDENIIESNNYVTIKYEPKNMIVEAGKKEIGSITARLIKASVEDQSIKIKCTLSATATERDTLGDKYENTLVSTILSKANASDINSYEKGNKSEMYTFKHDATEQLDEVTDYRYIGSSPNNYITFDNETWRIIGVFEDEYGIKRAKIVRDDYAALPYETYSQSFAWNESSYRSGSTSKPSYLNANTNWEDSNLYNHVVKRNITDGGLDHVDEVKFYLGATGNPMSSTTQFYSEERGKNVYSSIINPMNGSTSPNSINMTGKVGIMYASDYFYTYANGVDDICFNSPASCNRINGGNPESSWINGNGYTEHLINTYASGNAVFFITPSNSQYQISLNSPTASGYIREVVYLKADTVSESGDGTQDNPYVVESHDTKDYVYSLKNDSLVDSSKIESITFVNSNEVPDDAIVSWDATWTKTSPSKNGNIMAYTLDQDANGMYELYIGKKGKIYTKDYLSGLFSFPNVKKIEGLENFSIKNAYNLYGMFQRCGVESLDLRNFDVSMVETTEMMFDQCKNLVELNLEGWNTGELRNTQFMFQECHKLKQLDLSSWNTNVISKMSGMFDYCYEIEDINMANWNTMNVTEMRELFNYCKKLTKLNMTGWKTSSVTTMAYMFAHCESLTSLDLSNFDTTRVTNMMSMFDYCTNLTTLGNTEFNMYSVTDATYMFDYCRKLNATINLRIPPNNYTKMFLNTSTDEGTKLQVNYTSNSESFLDYMISNKDSYSESQGISNVIKGNLIS